MEKTALRADDVATFLAEHPDFFTTRPDLLESLELPVREMGSGVADMQQYVVARLRDEREKLRGATSELINISKSNLETQSRIHRAVLAILNARGFETFVEALQDLVPELLDLDAIALCFEECDEAPVPSCDGRVRRLVAGAVDQVLAKIRMSGFCPMTPGMRRSLARRPLKSDPPQLCALHLFMAIRSALLPLGLRNRDISARPKPMI